MLQFNRKITLQTEPGRISDRGVTEIERYLRRQNMPDLPIGWEWQWMVRAGEYRGSFPKRVFQYFYKAHGAKLTDAQKSEIGNLARVHTEDNQRYVFDFTDLIDWVDGDFADGGSCFWGDHSGARLMVEENGFAIRFFQPENEWGIGRAWVAPALDDCHIIFNGYGPWSDATLTIARIFALYRSQDYRQITLHALHGRFWVNNNRGFLVGPVAEIEHVSGYDLDWPAIYAYACYSCGVTVDEYDTYHGPDDRDYCETCHSDMFSTCDACGEAYFQHDIKWENGHATCDWCRRDGRVCHRCNKPVYRRDSIYRFKYDWYCKDCYTIVKTEAKKEKIAKSK